MVISGANHHSNHSTLVGLHGIFPPLFSGKMHYLSCGEEEASFLIKNTDAEMKRITI